VAAVNKLLQPVREHFKTDPEAKAILEQVTWTISGTAGQDYISDGSSVIDAGA
jgi:hypothetical protein